MRICSVSGLVAVDFFLSVLNKALQSTCVDYFLSFHPLRPMSVQQTVKTQHRIHQRVSQGRLVNMQKNHRASLLRVREKRHHPHTSQPLRRSTAVYKCSSPTKNVFTGLLLHLSTVAAPPNDFVLSAYTVACARSPAGRQLPPRHPTRARALHISMPERTASLPPPDAE